MNENTFEHRKYIVETADGQMFIDRETVQRIPLLERQIDSCSANGENDLLYLQQINNDVLSLCVTFVKQYCLARDVDVNGNADFFNAVANGDLVRFAEQLNYLECDDCSQAFVAHFADVVCDMDQKQFEQEFQIENDLNDKEQAELAEKMQWLTQIASASKTGGKAPIH